MGEQAHPAFKTTTRVCANCAKALRRLPNGQNEPTYGFRVALRGLGIFNKDKAHPSCVKELGAHHAAAKAGRV